jgi:ribosomal protein S18 acetylase RimI-like enzyme
MRAVFLARGATYTVDGLRAGAMWAPPGTWHVSFWELMRMGSLLIPFGRRIGEVMKGLSMLDEVHPREPHWYLAVLGTDPAHQGEGLGSALIREVTARADGAEMPCYLESSKRENLLFYGRHGFETIKEIHLPDGPPLWCMWREPMAAP